MLGCYSNKSPTNALPDSFDSNVSIVKGVEAIFNYCKAKAEAFGYNMFGADNKNCWSGDNAEGTYNTYGVSNLCSINGRTGNGVGKDKYGDVFVYKLE